MKQDNKGLIKLHASSNRSHKHYKIIIDNFINGVKFSEDKKVLVSFPINCVGSFIILNNVTKIESHAFEGCTGLISIEIPNNVTKIGPSAFSYCHNLTSIVIPDSVTEI